MTSREKTLNKIWDNVNRKQSLSGEYICSLKDQCISYWLIWIPSVGRNSNHAQALIGRKFSFTAVVTERHDGSLWRIIELRREEHKVEKNS